MTVWSFAIAVFALLAMIFSAPRLARRYWLLVAFAALAVDAVHGTVTESWTPVVGAMFGLTAYVVVVAVSHNTQVFIHRRRMATTITKEVK